MSGIPQLNIGGSLFSCPIPLVLEDRYFLVARGDKEDLFTVFFLKDGKPIFEIYENEPRENSVTEVTKTGAGIITVTDRQTGNFVYKVRPGYKGSSIFGRIKGGETEIAINDREIRVGGSTVIDCTIEAEVGIVLFKDGRTAIGAAIPAEARDLFVRR